MEKAAVEHSESKKKYKCTLTLAGDKKTKPIKISVNILQVLDSDKNVIQFTRDEGDLLQFNKKFQVAKDFFGGHVNSNL